MPGKLPPRFLPSYATAVCLCLRVQSPHSSALSTTIIADSTRTHAALNLPSLVRL